MDNAAENGHLDVVKWLRENYDVRSSAQTMKLAAINIISMFCSFCMRTSAHVAPAMSLTIEPYAS